MLKTGIVSVTFRKLGIEEIVGVTKKAALECIEWGSDVHVKPNDEEAVTLATTLCSQNGIKISSYGSYYHADGDDDEIEANVSTAARLGAETIRIWAGKCWSNDIDDAARALTVENIRRTCRCAAKYGLTVSPEYHGATLTDTIDSARRLIDEVDEENFRMYWQPNQFEDVEYNIRALRSILPYLTNVHVFSWKGNDMFPLKQGEENWMKYLDIIRSDGRNHNLLLEFVCDGTTDQLCRDAETLHKWLG